MQIKKAERINKKMKMGLFGPSGSGKTYSALQVAYGLTGNWEDIVVIDTENGSATDYANLSNFGAYSTLQLEPPYEPQRYINAIYECEKAGFKVIIIDSISHVWIGRGGCLDMQQNYGGRYQDWKQVTPQWEKLVDKIRFSHSHIIVCGRAKQEHALVEGKDGKKEVQKLGMGAQLRDGFEYEMIVSLEINMKHHAIAGALGKDRTGIFADQAPRILSSEDGKALAAWCNAGKTVEENPQEEEVNLPDPAAIRAEIRQLLIEKNFTNAQAVEVTGLKTTEGASLEELLIALGKLKVA